MNLVTLRLPFEPRRSFREWLSIVRARVMATEAHGDLPYEQLREEVERRGVTVPEIRLIFITTDLRPLRVADLTMSVMDMPSRTMPWGVTVFMDEHDEASGCKLELDAGIHDPAEPPGAQVARRPNIRCRVCACRSTPRSQAGAQRRGDGFRHSPAKTGVTALKAQPILRGTRATQGVVVSGPPPVHVTHARPTMVGRAPLLILPRVGRPIETSKGARGAATDNPVREESS